MDGITFRAASSVALAQTTIPYLWAVRKFIGFPTVDHALSQICLAACTLIKSSSVDSSASLSGFSSAASTIELPVIAVPFPVRIAEISSPSPKVSASFVGCQESHLQLGAFLLHAGRY